MTKEDWISRCAARLESRGGLDKAKAVEFADACLENLDGDISEPPEDSADDEMSCWTAD